MAPPHPTSSVARRRLSGALLQHCGLMRRISATCRWRYLALGVMLLLSVPGETIAQEPGVHYDTDSPAGKEYALPLDTARSQGSHKVGKRGGAVLFGAGIKKARPQPKPPTAATTAAQSRSGGGRLSSESDAETDRTSNQRAAAPPVTDAAAPDESGASGLLVGLGVGAVVLVGGIALSLLLARNRRPVTD
jgi:hypothetical protein